MPDWVINTFAVIGAWCVLSTIALAAFGLIANHIKASGNNNERDDR